MNDRKQILREKFLPQPEFEPQISWILVRCSTIELLRIPFQPKQKSLSLSYFPRLSNWKHICIHIVHFNFNLNHTVFKANKSIQYQV